MLVLEFAIGAASLAVFVALSRRLGGKTARPLAVSAESSR
jgi:hypothetical protein